MTDKTCKTCKWWGGWSSFPTHAPCRNKKFIYKGDSDEFDKDTLVYWDVEAYGAGFATGEGFGCIHWSSR